MLITINDRRFDIRFVDRGIPNDMDGFCEASTSSKPARIRIRRDLSRDRTLEVTIHELLHAARWSMSEEAVTTIAADIARTLIALKLC